MTILKIGEKEYKIQFGYKATADSEILKDMMQLDKTQDDTETIETVLALLPKLLLVGLQKYHKDEFECDLTDISGSDAESKVCDLLDDYFDDADNSEGGIFQILQRELVDNGFLSKLIVQGKGKKK